MLELASEEKTEWPCPNRQIYEDWDFRTKPRVSIVRGSTDCVPEVWLGWRKVISSPD